MTNAAKTEQKPEAEAEAKPPATRPLGDQVAIQHHAGAAGLPMPRTMAELGDLAQFMAKAGPMVGQAFQKNPGACMGIALQAMRWGLDPFACSQKAYQASKDADAPIAYEAQLVHAVIQKNAPLQRRLRCSYAGEGEARTCTVTGYLEGEGDEPFLYTSPPISKCRREKGSPLWKDDPDRQLWYYSVRAWARVHVPEVIMGVYTPDEVETIPEAKEGGTTLSFMGAAGEPAEDPDPADETTVDAEFEESEGGEPEPGVAASEDDDAGPGTATRSGPSETTKPGSEKDDRPESPSDGSEDGAAEDDQDDLDLLKSVDTKSGKARKTAFDYHRSAIARIAETGGPKGRAQAASLISEFDGKAKK